MRAAAVRNRERDYPDVEASAHAQLLCLGVETYGRWSPDYLTLVRQLAKQTLDKSSRFTDWSSRPLTVAQKQYALAEVTHLRIIYEILSKRLIETGRVEWVNEELKNLISPATYDIDPKNSWRRLKTKSTSRRFLGLVASLAEFRENFAQSKNIPRNRVIKDDALLELASNKPRNLDELSRSRLLL